MARSTVTRVISFEESNRHWDCLFDLMEEYQEEHPEATDDEAYEAVCWRIIPDRISARYDQMKEARREANP